jgi:DNA modification methylase
MAKIKVTCECGHTAEYDESEIHSHRLICGDSTDPAVIDRLMDGVKADMVMTDPPYGINAEKMTMGTGAKDFYRGEGWDSESRHIYCTYVSG